VNKNKDARSVIEKKKKINNAKSCKPVEKKRKIITGDPES